MAERLRLWAKHQKLDARRKTEDDVNRLPQIGK